MSTLMEQAHAVATVAAQRSAQAYLDQHYDGHDHGACGFAWAIYYPVNKGNTRDGKEERRMVEKVGFRKDYTGKVWHLRNPSGLGCQNVDAKFAGAREYARVMEKETGLSFSAGDRLD